MSLDGQTVGIFNNDSLSLNGYTLFPPANNEMTYLIDNCGFTINSWQSQFDPGMSAYLLENGNMLRAARINSNFNSGGTGGRIELFDWEGEIIWAYNYSSLTYHQHHDIEPLPNGNILILAWDRKTLNEAIEAGRDPNTMTGNSLWSEKVVEIEKIGDSEMNVVWQWFLWDHLVQDFNDTLPNYGAVADHPELINLNFVEGGTNADWIHANAIDYNPELDQIIISSRNFNEFWVIDHSTTTSEAAGHFGGNSGKGGDILYRWGNPQTYDRGTNDSRQLFSQHDVHWIEAGKPDAGKIMVFNNGQGRPGPDFSSIDVIDPPIENDGNYAIEGMNPFGPTDLFWTYFSDPLSDFFSSRISGAQRLINGNTLICEGRGGHFFEITDDGQIVWEYVSPVDNFGPVSQGDNPNANDVFRATRYGIDYTAFEGKDLSPGLPIEFNPMVNDCTIFGAPVSSFEVSKLYGVQALNTLVENELWVENLTGESISIEVSDLTRRIVFKGESKNELTNFDSRSWPNGMLVIQFINKSNNQSYIQKLIRL